ncbi:MAG: DUF2065 family protein [Pseudomonadota bacterium]|jgi:hypothetical protein
MADLATALGLVLVIEGITLAAMPGMLRRLVETLSTLPETVLRAGGLAAAAIGLLLVWLVRG